MIGKIITGKSFGGCINYCLHDKVQQPGEELVMKGRAEVLLFNQCYGNAKELVQQFNEVRRLNPKLSRPVLHITLSLAPGEQLSKDKLMEMSQACAKEMGFENNQYLAVEHLDTHHRHIHIIANRIGFDKRTVSDSNSYKKIANYCRKMEQRYHLQQVQNPRRYLSKEQRNTPRHDQRKERLRECIRQALARSNSYHEFEMQMKNYGYEIEKGRGISFTDEKKVRVKGSELNYSLQTIERFLERKRMLQAQNIPISKSQKTLRVLDDWPQQNHSATIEKEVSKVLQELLKPEVSQQQVDPHFLQKPKKRKGPSQHL